MIREGHCDFRTRLDWGLNMRLRSWQSLTKKSWLWCSRVWRWSPVWNQSWPGTEQLRCCSRQGQKQSTFDKLNSLCVWRRIGNSAQPSFCVKIETPSALSGRMKKKGPSRVNPRSPKDINAYAGNSSLFLLGCCPALPIFYMNESEKWHNQSKQFNKLPDTIGSM